MRLIPLALVATAAIAMVSPATAGWKEYKYEDLVVAKEFPGEPKIEDGQYKAPVAGTAPAKILTVEQDNVVYRMTVADLHDKLAISAAIMGECTYLAEAAGKSIVNMTARIGHDVYGRIQSTDLKDGSRAMTECLFTNGRLYKIEAIISPKNDDFPNSPQAIRFVNSIDFDLKGEEAAAETATTPAAGGGARAGGRRAPAGQ